MTYKLVKNIFSGEVDKVFKSETLSWIPLDPANTDYQQYLEWLSEGNEPLPADEPTQGETV